MPYLLGIDLGTTNTSASFLPDTGAPIALNLGGVRTPTVMRTAALKLAEDRWLAGEEARQYVERSPEAAHQLLTAFKPLLMLPERGHTRWQADVSGDRYFLTDESAPATPCPPGFTPPDIRRATREMLAAVQKRFRSAYPVALDRVVIGIPVSFPDSARQKLLDCAVEAELVPERRQAALFPEPLAVALAYGIEHQTPQRVLVFDHGGGTLDLTILDVEGRPNQLRYKVLAQSGHNRAGRYYDRLLLSGVFRASGARGQEALSRMRLHDPMDISQPGLLDEAERVKERLFDRAGSGKANFTYPIDQKPFDVPISAQLFAETIAGELATIRSLLRELIGQVHGPTALGSGPAGVQMVLLAGGSSLLPDVQQVIREVFPDVPISHEYAGTRTSTAGFAAAVQYRNMIDELTETEFSLYDPVVSRPVTVLPFGTQLSEATLPRRRCHPDGYYFRAPEGRGTLLLFEHQNERHQLVLQANLTDCPREEVLQAIVTVDSDTGRPLLQVVSTRTGELFPVEILPPDHPDVVALLQPGHIVAYQGNGYPGYPEVGVGCIDRIDMISGPDPARSYSELPMAVGNLHRYRLFLHFPGNHIIRVRATTPTVRRYDTPFPRPGVPVALTVLDQRRLQLVGSEAYYAVVPVRRPEECAGQAPAPPDAPDAPPGPDSARREVHGTGDRREPSDPAGPQQRPGDRLRDVLRRNREKQ